MGSRRRATCNKCHKRESRLASQTPCCIHYCNISWQRPLCKLNHTNQASPEAALSLGNSREMQQAAESPAEPTSEFTSICMVYNIIWGKQKNTERDTSPPCHSLEVTAKIGRYWKGRQACIGLRIACGKRLTLHSFTPPDTATLLPPRSLG